jgi:hypothetical protein
MATPSGQSSQDSNWHNNRRYNRSIRCVAIEAILQWSFSLYCLQDLLVGVPGKNIYRACGLALSLSVTHRVPAPGPTSHSVSVCTNSEAVLRWVGISPHGLDVLSWNRGRCNLFRSS